MTAPSKSKKLTAVVVGNTAAGAPRPPWPWSPGRRPRGLDGRRSGLEVLHLFEEPADLQRPEPAVSAQRPGRPNLSRPGPAGGPRRGYTGHHPHLGPGEQL